MTDLLEDPRYWDDAVVLDDTEAPAPSDDDRPAWTGDDDAEAYDR